MGNSTIVTNGVRRLAQSPIAMIPELVVVLVTPGFGLNHWFHAFGLLLNDG